MLKVKFHFNVCNEKVVVAVKNFLLCPLPWLFDFIHAVSILRLLVYMLNISSFSFNLEFLGYLCCANLCYSIQNLAHIKFSSDTVYLT